MELAGRNALVTGGGTRLGRALATALAEAGCAVALQYWRSAIGAREAVETIEAGGGRSRAFCYDLSQPPACSDLLRDATAGLGTIEILVNSAAVFLPGTLASTTVAEWEAQFALNLRAPFLLTQAFASRLGASRPGRVVNIADARVRRAASGHLAYRLTKAALAHMTEVLAVELAPWVTVNAVAPGAILTPPGEAAEAFAERVGRVVPLRRPGGPQSLVDAVLYLLRADFATGVVLPLDGGEYL